MTSAAYHSVVILICYAVLCSGITNAEIVVGNEYNETVEKFMDEKISYAADLETLKGLVVLAHPFNACNPIQEAFNLSPYRSFVLIDGNVSADCPGYLKILNAQRAGFDAAVLFGNILPVGNVSLSLDLVIPAVKVENDVGFKIMNKYIFKTTSGSDLYWLKLISDSHGSATYPHIYMIAFAGVMAFFIFCILAIFAFVQLQSVCSRIRDSRERCNSPRNVLSKQQIRQLRMKKFAEGDSDNSCAVCYQEYIKGEKLWILPCHHAFHMKCIDIWLRCNSATCPLCRRNIEPQNANSPDCNDSSVNSLHTNEESPLIILHQQNYASNSRLVLQRVNPELTPLLCDTDYNNSMVLEEENGARLNLLAEVHSSSEITDSHQLPSTYGSINNHEKSNECVDALTSGEAIASSEIRM